MQVLYANQGYHCYAGIMIILSFLMHRPVFGLKKEVVKPFSAMVFSACSWIDMKEITATNDLVTVNQDHISKA
ncbi:hypothetical protein V6Z12_A11G379900 [Gossypium hirsutum]